MKPLYLQQIFVIYDELVMGHPLTYRLFPTSHGLL